VCSGGNISPANWPECGLTNRLDIEPLGQYHRCADTRLRTRRDGPRLEDAMPPLPFSLRTIQLSLPPC
jgi:hypothetical protein